MDQIEDVGPDQFVRGITERSLNARTDVPPTPIGIQNGDNVRGILDQRAEACLAGLNLGVEPRSRQRHIDVLAQRQRQPEIPLAQPHVARTLDIERTHHSALVAERHAHFRDNAVHGSEKCGIGAHILEQHRLTCADDPAHDPLLNGDTLQHAVVADLMLKHEVVAVEEVDTDLRVAEGVRDGVDHRLEEPRQLQFTRQRRADDMEQRELPRLPFRCGEQGLVPLLVAPQGFLGLLALRHVARVHHDAAYARVGEAVAASGLKPPPGPVVVADAHLDRWRAVRLLHGIDNELLDLAVVFRMDHGEHGTAAGIVGGIAKQLLHCRADVLRHPVRIEDDNEV
ncbi:MAG: hypothetical protein M3Q03_14395 [Chloroflexota bacterium]|nr:hypothetical protein [Chloroflexota bacterium]